MKSNTRLPSLALCGALVAGFLPGWGEEDPTANQKINEGLESAREGIEELEDKQDQIQSDLEAGREDLQALAGKTSTC